MANGNEAKTRRERQQSKSNTNKAHSNLKAVRVAVFALPLVRLVRNCSRPPGAVAQLGVPWATGPEGAVGGLQAVPHAVHVHRACRDAHRAREQQAQQDPGGTGRCCPAPTWRLGAVGHRR